MHKYKWLLFDADNTFLDFSKASKVSFFKTCEEYNLQSDDHSYKVYKAENAKVWESFENKEITAIELRSIRFAKYFEAANIQGINSLDFNTRYLEILVEVSEAYEGAIEFLDSLRKDYKISVITNGLKEVQRPRLQRLKMNHIFDSIIVSDEIGVAKPDVKFFEYSYNTIPNPPQKSDILVIGDNLKSDILGGQNFGVNTCWINHSKENSTSIKPTYSIKNLLELPSIL